MNKSDKIEEVRQQIGRIIEAEYRKALAAGLLNPLGISNEIMNLLIEKNALYVPIPESASGCYEDFEK